MLDLLNALYQECRSVPAKSLAQCYALTEVAYLIGSGHAPACLLRAAYVHLQAAFGK